MIELSGIHKSFNDKEVIKGIELNVDKGSRDTYWTIWFR